MGCDSEPEIVYFTPSPPAWILGTWSDDASTSFVFTEDNIILKERGITVDAAQVFKNNNATFSAETKNDSLYSIYFYDKEPDCDFSFSLQSDGTLECKIASTPPRAYTLRK